MVAKDLVLLNISQSIVISLGICGSLCLANYFFEKKELTVGEFVMFNSYNLQIYMPLGFLGTLWRWMKQSLVDVEFVISLMNTQEFIPELDHPEECKIKTG